MKKSNTRLLLVLSTLLLAVFVFSCSDENDDSSVVITGITPSSVPAGGMITIRGENLSGASVTIAGIASSVTSNTSTAITTTVPVSVAAGVQEVKVTTAQGSATANITVTSAGTGPVISNISPASIARGDIITINGVNLSGASVTIGSIASSVTSNTSTTITAMVPASVAAGVQEVKVTTAQGSATANITVTNSSAPVITAVVPSNVARGDTLTILGSGLANVVVEIATKVSVIVTSSDTATSVIVPTNIALGAASVRVTGFLVTAESSVNIIN